MYRLIFFCSSFLVNSQDRVIRVFDREMVLKCGNSIDPEPIQKLQDLVNRSVESLFGNPFFKDLVAIYSRCQLFQDAEAIILLRRPISSNTLCFFLIHF